MLCFEDEGLLNGSLAYVDFSLLVSLSSEFPTV